MDDIKWYYIKGEHYDWVTDPRRLERIHHRKREQETLALIGRYNKGSVTLDSGCGTGLITRHLKGIVIGLDINEWNLRRAKQHAPGGNYILGDTENLPICSNQIDAVVCTETLEHLPQPEKAIAEFARVLKPGGRLMGSVPHRNIIWRFRKYALSTCPASEPFHRNYTISEIRHLLQEFKPIAFFRGVFGLIAFFVVEKKPPTDQ